MSKLLDLKNPGRLIHVGVILPDGVSEILDIAPIDALHSICKEHINQFPDELLPAHLKAQAVDLKVHWVSEAGKGTSHLTSGINVVPTDSYENCPQLDIVLIGAQMPPFTASEADLAFIRKSFENCSAFITICGGMQLPMQAGILQGKRATAPRFMLEQLKQQNPAVDWQEKRWVRDGKLWTSGTLLNGLDLMRAFCEQTWGTEEGSLVNLILDMGAFPVRDVDYKDGP